MAAINPVVDLAMDGDIAILSVNHPILYTALNPDGEDPKFKRGPAAAFAGRSATPPCARSC